MAEEDVDDIQRHFIQPDDMPIWIEKTAAECIFSDNVAGLHLLFYRAKNKNMYGIHVSMRHGTIMNLVYITEEGRHIGVQELIDKSFKDYQHLVMIERKADGTTIH